MSDYASDRDPMDAMTTRLNDVFREILDDDGLVISDETVAADVENWDSLNHIKLVVAIEECFDVKFSNREIASWTCVGDMKRSLATRLRG
jgi:acyl carrier protein